LAAAARRPALSHVLQREAGDALVVVRKPLKLGLGYVAVEVVERLVAHQLLHAPDDVVRGVLAVGAHHLGRRPRA